MLGWYSISGGGRRHKITADPDCLPPNAEKVFRCVLEDPEAMVAKAKVLEREGIEVCIDLGNFFYETEEEP